MNDYVSLPAPEVSALQAIVERVSQTGKFKFNRDTPLEWWYITGFLWDEDQCANFGAKAFPSEVLPRLGFQTTYFAGTQIEQKQHSSVSLQENKFLGLMAHAAFSKIDKKVHSSSTRYARLPLTGGQQLFSGVSNFASVSNDVFHVNIADWKLTQVSLKPVQFIASQTVKNLSINYHAQVSPHENDTKTGGIWLQGQNGIAEKLDGLKNAYVTIPFLRISAHLTEFFRSETEISNTSRSEGIAQDILNQKSQTMCGTAWLDHESGITLSKDSGWTWLSLKTPDHEAFMVYKLKDRKSQNKEFVSFRNSNGRQFLGEIQTWKEESEACIGDPKKCYPQKITFEAVFKDFGTIWFSLESFFEDQEVQGPEFQIHSRYWEGAIKFDYKTALRSGKGLGYMEIVKP